jgi:hypothetical protein
MSSFREAYSIKHSEILPSSFKQKIATQTIYRNQLSNFEDET